MARLYEARIAQSLEQGPTALVKVPILKASIPRLNGRSVQLPPKQRAHYYADPQHIPWANEVKKRAHYTCERCGVKDKRMYADHIKEVRDGGTWALSNGQCLCPSCHTTKTMIERAKRAMHEWKGA